MRVAALAALVLVAASPLPDLKLAGVAQQGGLLQGVLPRGATDLSLDGKAVRTAPDGRFLIGFGRDAAPSATLAWHMGAITRDQKLAIAPRQWRIQSLPTLPPHPVPDAEYEARRPAEVQRIAAARGVISDETGWRDSFTAPVKGPITGVYGSQRILAGTPILAPAAGVVRLADGPFMLEGNLVMVDHGMGLVTAYLHMSRIDVKVGEHVDKGQRLGLVGGTGRATGPHLHWAATWTDVRIDPAVLVAPIKKEPPNG